MQQALLTFGLVLGLTSLVKAQGMEVHTRIGPSGTHFTLDADTQTFNYEATITGSTLAYTATLEVYHNGVLKASVVQVVLLPNTGYTFAAPIHMGNWGLRAGDNVVFRLKVLGLTLGNLLANHTLIGDVVETTAPKTN